MPNFQTPVALQRFSLDDPRPFRARRISPSWTSSVLQPLSFARVFLISSLVAEISILVILASAARKGVVTRTLLGSSVRVSRDASAAAFSLFWSSETSRTTPPVIVLRILTALMPTSARETLSLAPLMLLCIFPLSRKR